MLIPLACDLESRDATLAQDARLLNCYWEPKASGGSRIIKRAGLAATAGAAAAGTAQGIVCCFLVPYAVTNDTLYNVLSGASIALPAPSGNLASTSLSVTAAGGVEVSYLKTSNRLWKLTGNPPVPTRVTDADYPSGTVAGIVYLDGTYYVMDLAGIIWGSDIEDGTSWTALNFIGIDRGIGAPVALFRHLNYVTAFCKFGIQFFFDNSNPAPGSPLSASQNTLFNIGCAVDKSLQSINDGTVFISRTRQFGRSVHFLEGLTPRKISTPIVDRILNASPLTSFNSFCTKHNGHDFYVLTLVDLNLTLAYDFITGTWAQWSYSPDGSTDNLFPIAYSNYNGGVIHDVLLHSTSGVVYTMEPTTYQDNGLAIRCSARTRNFDHATSGRKRASDLAIAGDKINANVGVRWSDDDYNTWSAYRNVDMNIVFNQLRQLGMFYRRAFEFLHTANTPLRLEAFELPDEPTPQPT